MPAHTPSPHRFLPPAQSSQKTRLKGPSSLRHGVSAQAPSQSSDHTFVVHHSGTQSVDQPKATPAKRFIIGSSQRHTPRPADGNIGPNADSSNGEDLGPENTPTISRVAPARLRKLESIEDSSPASSIEHAEQGDVLQSIELVHHPDNDGSQTRQVNKDEDILFITEERHKRRRVTPQPYSDSLSSPPSHRIDHRQVRTPAPASHRFKVPPPKTPATSDNHSATPGNASTHRPQFILPHSSPSPTKNSTPLPETFSPSRKNGKYIPGGLAATLQSWVMETAESGYSARSTGAAGAAWSKDKDDGVQMRVRVTRVSGNKHNEDGGVECRAGGVVFIHGTTDASLYNASRMSSIYQHIGPQEEGEDEDGAEVHVLLAGQGGARRKAGVVVREGTVIGIRAPLWDVDVGEGAKWIVGVEWIVLS